jgi:hypothetical protein
MTHKVKMNCSISAKRIHGAVSHYRSNAFEPCTLREWIAKFGEVYSAHFVREFCLCKDGMVRVRRVSTFGKWADEFGGAK